MESCAYGAWRNIPVLPVTSFSIAVDFCTYYYNYCFQKKFGTAKFVQKQTRENVWK